MDDATGRTPLRVDMRVRKPPVRWAQLPRIVRYPAIIVGAVVLFLVQLGLDRVWPGAGVAFFLGLTWLVALGMVTSLALFWRAGGRNWLPVRWQVVLVLAAAWFVARAAFKTYEVLG